MAWELGQNTGKPKLATIIYVVFLEKLHQSNGAASPVLIKFQVAWVYAWLLSNDILWAHTCRLKTSVGTGSKAGSKEVREDLVREREAL